MTELPLSNQSNPSQGKDPSGNPELQSTLELKKFLYSICEPMCLKIVQQNPKDIPNYMLNYLKTKYGYSSSGLCFEEQKELEYLRSQVEMFKDIDEHIYYTELNKQGKKEVNKPAEKKGKGAQKVKQRLLPLEENVDSDDEDYKNLDDVDPNLDNIDYI